VLPPIMAGSIAARPSRPHLVFPGQVFPPITGGLHCGLTYPLTPFLIQWESSRRSPADSNCSDPATQRRAPLRLLVRPWNRSAGHVYSCRPTAGSIAD
jgi:hypothetical protein